MTHANRVGGLVLCLAAWLTLGASLHARAQAPVRTGTVLASTPMFWLPEDSGSPITILAAGTTVDVIQREGNWYKVIYHDTRFGDETGFVAAANLRVDTGAGGELSVRNGAVTLAQRGFIEGRAFVFPQTAPNDSTNLVGDALLREEVFLRSSKWLQFAAGLDLRASSHDEVENEWRLDISDRGLLRPRASIRRLTATVTAGNFTLDVGKQFIRWGRADVFNPTDRFAARDFLNVIDSDFLPVLAARPSIQLGNETIEAVWVPRMTPSRMPLLTQRWTALPPEASGVVIQDGGSIVPSGAEQGLRWNHTGDRFDASISFFNGFNHLPDIETTLLPSGTDVLLTRLYPALRTYGADVAVPTSLVTVKGEAAYFTSPTGTSEEYVLYVVELERQKGEWIFVGGYAGDIVTKSSAGFPFAPDRGIAKSFLGRASYTVGPRRSVAIEGAVRQAGEGFYVKGDYSEAIGDHWRLTVTGVGITGNSDDFLGQYQRNSHVSAGLRFSF